MSGMEGRGNIVGAIEKGDWTPQLSKVRARINN